MEEPDVEVVLKRVRQVGIGLLVAAIFADALYEPVMRSRVRVLMFRQRMRRRVEPPAATIAALASSILDSTSPRPNPPSAPTPH
jgi:hypothetical protein